MQWIPITVIVVYLVGTTAVGALLAGRTKSAKEWAVAGGGMGMLMITVGIAGTRIGGVGTYGVAGDVITGGVWNLWYGINTFLALALVGVFYAIPYRRLKLQTVGEIFQIRFGSRRCQVLTSLCVQTEYFLVNIIEPFIVGKILSTVIPGLPFWAAVFIAAFIFIIYTSLGGLWGSSATNLIHCTVILVGLFAVGIAGLNHLGGWEGVTTKVNAALEAAGKDEAAWWSFTGVGWRGWAAIISMFFAAAIHTPAASIYVNFSSAAKSEKILIPGFLLAGVLGASMPFLAGWIGIEVLAKYGVDAQISSYNLITQLALDISPWIGGLALAAVLAAVISSGGPILLSSSTMFVQDWLPFTRDYNPEKKLKAFRIATVVYGLVAATIAWLVEENLRSVLKLLLVGFALVVPPAIAVGYLIYWKRTTEAGAFWGIIAGYGTGLVWYLIMWWANATGFDAPEGASAFRRVFYSVFAREGGGIDGSYATTLIPLVAVPLISLMTAEDREGKEEFYKTLSTKPTDG